MIPTPALDNGVGLSDGLPRIRVLRKLHGQQITGKGSFQGFILLSSNTFSCNSANWSTGKHQQKVLGCWLPSVLKKKVWAEELAHWIPNTLVSLHEDFSFSPQHALRSLT